MTPQEQIAQLEQKLDSIQTTIDELIRARPSLEEAARLAKERAESKRSICQGFHNQLLVCRGSDSPDRDERIRDIEFDLKSNTFQLDCLEDAYFESERAVNHARERLRHLESESQALVFKLRSVQRAPTP